MADHIYQSHVVQVMPSEMVKLTQNFHIAPLFFFEKIPGQGLCAPKRHDFFAKFRDPRFWADVAMSIICFGPLNIIIWRGVWDFQVCIRNKNKKYTIK